jgi:hypothetical protein
VGDQRRRRASVRDWVHSGHVGLTSPLHEHDPAGAFVPPGAPAGSSVSGLRSLVVWLRAAAALGGCGDGSSRPTRQPRWFSGVIPHAGALAQPNEVGHAAPHNKPNR